MKQEDPAHYGLSAKTVLLKLKPGSYRIVIHRKSRIIMKDGERILGQVEKIREVDPEARVSLRTTAPVCSKTAAFLESKGVAVEREEG